MAARRITGTSKLAGQAAQEVLAGLLPVKLRLEARAFAVALKLRSVEPTHPVAAQVARARKWVTKAHALPLARLLCAFPLLSRCEVETISATPVEPSAAHLKPDSISVPSSRKASVAEHDRLLARTALDPRVIHAYSDGSRDEDGYVGAGLAIRTVVLDEAVLRSRQRPLGAHPGAQASTGGARNGIPGAAFSTTTAAPNGACPRPAPRDHADARQPPSAPDRRPLYVAQWSEFSYPMDRGRTVFEGEGLGLGKTFVEVKLLADEDTTTAHLWIDNMATTTTGLSPSSRPGQAIARAARGAFLAFRRQCPGIKVHVHWLAGHEGVEGNERADTLAKDAAAQSASLAREARQRDRGQLSFAAGDFELCYETGTGTAEAAAPRRAPSRRQPAPARARGRGRGRLPDPLDLFAWAGRGEALPVGRSVADLRAEFKVQLRAKAAAAWAAGKTGAALRAVWSRPISADAVSLEQKVLTRRQFSLLSQIRTATCFNHDLFVRSLRDSAACPCGAPREDRRHFLLHCPLYRAPRAALMRALKSSTISLADLGNDRKVLHVLDYINATGRFPKLYSPVTEAQRSAMKAARRRKTRGRAQTRPPEARTS
ncbi:MAG: hypothetical protein INR64_13525 [Caulobacteraceae bacterium]|nr:hypothetical protein [Caulobacter sp.]